MRSLLNLNRQNLLNNCELIQFSQTLDPHTNSLGAGLDILSTLVDELVDVFSHLTHLLFDAADEGLDLSAFLLGAVIREPFNLLIIDLSGDGVLQSSVV